MACDDIIYRLNDRDEIVFVNTAWDHYATANEGGHLANGGVIGRSLWEFIADSPTRHLYHDVLDRVREGRAVCFPFRCDSPPYRRQMSMNVVPIPGGEIEFRVRLLVEDVHDAVRLIDAKIPRSSDLLRVCGWCKRVDVAGGWLEMEEAIIRLRLFDRPLLPSLTHGMCDECFVAMTQYLAQT